MKLTSSLSHAPVSLLTRRITALTSHLQTHPKDVHSRRGLVTILAARRKLLQYLSRSAPTAFSRILKELTLKDTTGPGSRHSK